MWIFLLSDTFIFTCFLTGYMNVRVSTPVPWPNPSEVFGLEVFGVIEDRERHLPRLVVQSRDRAAVLLVDVGGVGVVAVVTEPSLAATANADLAVR